VGSWFALAGVVFLFFGMETKGRSFEDIEDELGAVAPVAEAAADYLK
jgi:putative MFS transporter